MLHLKYSVLVWNPSFALSCIDLGLGSCFCCFALLPSLSKFSYLDHYVGIYAILSTFMGLYYICIHLECPSYCILTDLYKSLFWAPVFFCDDANFCSEWLQQDLHNVLALDSLIFQLMYNVLLICIIIAWTWTWVLFCYWACYLYLFILYTIKYYHHMSPLFFMIGNI